MLELFRDQIFDNRKSFALRAIELFHLQYEHNPVYRKFVDTLGVDREQVFSLDKIPFLPVSFFKNHTVISGSRPTQMIFESSGTTGQIRSKHHVVDAILYKESILRGFRNFFGEPTDFAFIGLIPGYSNRKNASLIYMLDQLIKWSEHPLSGYYTSNRDLINVLNEAEHLKQKTILIGVTYALLDLIEKNAFQLEHTLVMVTGGMKGKREEITREELHEILKKGFGVEKIYSEYGMTELLSQAYSKGDGIFYSPEWMRIMIRDIYDPFSFPGNGKSGGVNIIDFANLYSCSFIATDDLGKTNADGSFEIQGRLDGAEIRGCNLMIESA